MKRIGIVFGFDSKYREGIDEDVDGERVCIIEAL